MDQRETKGTRTLSQDSVIKPAKKAKAQPKERKALTPEDEGGGGEDGGDDEGDGVLL